MDFSKLIKTANLHDQNKRYILSDVITQFMTKLAIGKFKVVPHNGYWVAEVDFKNKDFAKNAGFKWDGKNKQWTTNSPTVVDNLDKNLWEIANKSALQTITTAEENGMNIDVTYDGVNYYAKGMGTHYIKDKLKRAGFTWSPRDEAWLTQKPQAAAALKSEADLYKYLEASSDYDRDAYRKSYQMEPEKDYNLIQPANKEKKHYPNQEVAIDYTLDKLNNKGHGVILGDPAGSGKTSQAIGVVNNLTDLHQILIIATGKTKTQWEKELKLWLAKDYSIGIVETGFWPKADIVICSWDMLGKFKAITDRTTFDLIIADEAHKMKNIKSGRAKHVIGAYNKELMSHQGGLKAKHKIALTATPISNRPHELWSILYFIDPQKFHSYKDFKNKYGIFKQIEVDTKLTDEEKSKMISMGEDPDEQGGTRRVEAYFGPQNLDLLNQTLRSEYMVRRRKEDILKDVPPKTRQLIELSLSNNVSPEIQDIIDELGLDDELDYIDQLEKDMEEKAHLEKVLHSNPDQQNNKELLNKITTLSHSEKEYAAQLDKLNTKLTDPRVSKVAFEKIAAMRHQDGLDKAPFIVEHILDILEESPNEKITVFVHHQDVFEMVKNGVEAVYPDSVLEVKGGTSDEKTFKAVQEFQNNPAKKVFLGSLQAVKEGMDGLQKVSSRLIFGEISYVPADMEQAEGRLFRNLQGKPVLIDYIVKHNSIDYHMARHIATKMRMTDQALEVREPTSPNLVKDINHVDDEIAELQKQSQPTRFTEGQLKAIKEAMIFINGQGKIDPARGFIASDEKFGKSIANQLLSGRLLSPRQYEACVKLLAKYKDNLLAPELIAAIWG